MSDEIVIDVPPAFAKNAIIDERRYKELRAESTKDPLTFWREAGKRLDWITPYRSLKDVSFDAKDLHIRELQLPRPASRPAR
jgi:acetyl-CoA synthetase